MGAALPESIWKLIENQVELYREFILHVLEWVFELTAK